MVAADGLLRRLPAATSSAVMWDVNRLQHMSTELEAVAALSLHLRKTVLVPLGRTTAEVRWGLVDWCPL